MSWKEDYTDLGTALAGHTFVSADYFHHKVEKRQQQKEIFYETFTEGGGFVSKHLGNPLGNPLLSTGRSDPWIS